MGFIIPEGENKNKKMISANSNFTLREIWELFVK